MKAIRQYVEMGIPTVSDLKDALQLAMQLEFSTIPPYLCAQWSILEGILHKIVSQEMFHFALAGNLLTAIGGEPNIAHSDFLPKYPLGTLPGGVYQVAIDLMPLTRRQIAVFMQIEYPEFPPIAVTSKKRPATIGGFYSTIVEALNKLHPTIYANARWIEVPFAKKIHSVADAVATINRIKSEGEGLQDSPEEPVADHSYAHYYLFKEIYVGRRLIKVGSKWKFEGDAIQMPKIFNFKRCMLRRERCIPFREALSQLLIDLQECWTRDSAVNVPAMFELQILGRKLIETRPEFTWERGTN